MKMSRLLLCFCFITQAAAQTPGKYSFAYTTAPENVPTAKVPDAPLAGNGDIGVTFGGTPDHLKLYIGKNDFWRAYPVYPGGGIAFPGRLDIIINELKGAQYYAEQIPTEGAIHATFTKDDLKVEVNTLVTAMHNTVITEITTNKTCNIKLDLWAPEGNTAVVKKDPNRVSRSFANTPLLEWPAEVTLTLKVFGDQQLQPGKKLTITVSTDKTVITEEKIQAMKTAHQQWWHQFWQRSGIEVNDTLLEKYYTNSQYLFASSSRENKYAPGIWGPFITKDSSAWGGDYHLNYNYQAPYWAAFSSNYIDLTENFDQPLLDYMEKGRWHAKDLLNMRGIYFPVGIGPKGLCTTLWPLTPDEMEKRYGTRENTIDHGYKFLGQKINAVFSVGNMLMRFYSTYDEEYAKKVYPYMLACADFWEDYLKFENGRYVIENDHYGEVMPNLKNKGQWRNLLGDYNSTLSLGLVKMLFKGMINVSTYLHKDAARQEKWRHILTHLSAFPTEEIDGRVRLKSVEKSPAAWHNQPTGLARVSIHGLILPGEVCGPVTDSAFNAILLSDVSHWKDKMQQPGEWGNTLGNGIETCFPAAVRVGYDADEIIKQLKDRIKVQSLRNGWITAAGGGTETLSAVPLTINEMLLQSYEGRVRIFPNWNHQRDAKFHHLRAYGAFVISSSLKNGRVEYVEMKSEKGRTCEMENPWPGESVKLIRNNKPSSSTLTGRTITFETSKNETIQLSPLK